MSHDKDRQRESLVPFVGGEIVRTSTSLVWRGLSLLNMRKPTEGALMNDDVRPALWVRIAGGAR